MGHTFSVASAKAKFSECVKTAEAGEPVVITRYGKPVVALVPAEDLEELVRKRTRTSERGSLLTLVGLDDTDEFAEIIDEVVSERGMPRAVAELE